MNNVEREQLKQQILKQLDAYDLAAWVLYRLALRQGITEIEYAEVMVNAN